MFSLRQLINKLLHRRTSRWIPSFTVIMSMRSKVKVTNPNSTSKNIIPESKHWHCVKFSFRKCLEDETSPKTSDRFVDIAPNCSIGRIRSRSSVVKALICTINWEINTWTVSIMLHMVSSSFAQRILHHSFEFLSSWPLSSARRHSNL